ncbi:MAG TPA: signal peptidase II [Caldisericia bacterium]|nr:signal peptidase II [Caldisericia bacterium]HQL66444.1 signal peptidase II [Caldisericia bacterium]
MKFYYFIYFLIFTSIFIFLDRISKYFVVKNLDYNEKIHIFKDLLKFEKVENRGGIFGIFPEGRYFFIIISFIALMLLLYFFIKIEPKTLFIAFNISLIISGILGNLIDRLKYGYVIDFISVKNFPVFNLSDSYITIGIVLMLIFLWKMDL